MSLKEKSVGRIGAAICIIAGLLFAQPAHADNLDVRSWLARPGVRLLVVEFYATWCEPCMAAVPRWQALYEKYRDQGLRMVVVNTLDPDMGCTSPGWTPDGVLCDPDGVIQKGMGVGGNLPAAFLWNWQGDLLVRAGHVEGVEAAVEAYFKRNPRVLVEATNEKNRPLPAVADQVRGELRRTGKFTLVASKEERKALARIRKASHRSSYDTASQCKLGAEVSANTLLKARVFRDRLSLSLFSAETSCLIAQAGTRYSPKRSAEAIAEAVDKLLTQIRREVQTLTSLAPPKAPTIVDKPREVAEATAEREPPRDPEPATEVIAPNPGVGRDNGRSLFLKFGLRYGVLFDGNISWSIPRGTGSINKSVESGKLAACSVETLLGAGFWAGVSLMAGEGRMTVPFDTVESAQGIITPVQPYVKTPEVSLLGVGPTFGIRYRVFSSTLRAQIWLGYQIMERKSATYDVIQPSDGDVLFTDTLDRATSEGLGLAANAGLGIPFAEDFSFVVDVGILAQPVGKSGDVDVTFDGLPTLTLGMEYGWMR